MLSVIYRDDSVLVSLGGMPYSVFMEDPRYEQVLDLIKKEDEEALRQVLSTKYNAKSIVNELQQFNFTLNNNVYYYKENPINMDLSKYLTDALVRKVSVIPIINFIKNLFNNPNYNTRQQLFSFMQKNNMPIESDGCFLAYKVVRSDYKDKHTGTMDNSPGSKLSVPWDAVDTNPERTCSRGLHCCSFEYCSVFFSPGDRLVCVKVNPADVGAVPSDYNGSKLRAKAYEVVSDITDQWLQDMRNMSLRTDSGLNAVKETNNIDMYRTYF